MWQWIQRTPWWIPSTVCCLAWDTFLVVYRGFGTWSTWPRDDQVTVVLGIILAVFAGTNWILSRMLRDVS